MSKNTVEDLCEVVERMRKENAGVRRLVFTLPGLAKVELTFLRDGVTVDDGPTQLRPKVP